YAFGKEVPVPGYEELSGLVVRYVAGLHLTIKFLGSFLCGKNDVDWKDAIERLKTIPLKENLDKLELSYKGLEEDYKEIFLDVACILKGWPKDNAVIALQSCGFHARNGLRVLEERSLMNISQDGYLEIHDHIEEMGMNIVRRVNPNKPERHSRLWIDEEIEDILANDSAKSENNVSSVKILALESLQKLANTVRRVLSKLELSIHKNSSKITVSASGGIHPLNDSVMNYLSSLANYGSSLSDIIIGNEWIVKHEMKLNQYALSYELTSWNKVIACLPKDLQVPPEKVRDCFRKLYFTFQEVCERQISWIVVDGKMRDKMEASIVNKLVPMYEEFYGNHLLTLSEDEQCIKILIRLSPENMVKNLTELFPGTPVVQKAKLCSN
nr:Toll/interleukin-1 receptor (TIR) domain-containing protein [Tanacetum cinerariifolium]